MDNIIIEGKSSETMRQQQAEDTRKKMAKVVLMLSVCAAFLVPILLFVLGEATDNEWIESFGGAVMAAVISFFGVWIGLSILIKAFQKKVASITMDSYIQVNETGVVGKLAAHHEAVPGQTITVPSSDGNTSGLTVLNFQDIRLVELQGAMLIVRSVAGDFSCPFLENAQEIQQVILAKTRAAKG